MMRIATVNAYDVLSTVHATLHVRVYPDHPGDGSSIELECTTVVPGTGESDPRLWAQDALVALLEAL